MNFGLEGFPRVPGFDAMAKAVSTAVGGTSGAGGSTWAQSGNLFGMKVGVSTPAGALMTISADGLGYPAQTADYAVKPNYGDVLIAPTSVVGGAPVHYDRTNVLQAANGDIIIASAFYTSGAPTSIAVYRYNASGALQGSVALDSLGNAFYDPHMAMLSNGNIVVSYCDTVNLRFSIVTQALAVVKPATTVDSLGSSAGYMHNMIALSGGGFMLSWQDKTTATNYNNAVFDNSGSVVSSKAVIRAVTGSATHTRSVQLSNGNVAMLIVAGNKSYVGILSPAGAVVLPFAEGDPMIPAAIDVHALPGFFAVVGKEYLSGGGNNLKMRIYSNDGVQQGQTVSLTSTSQDLGGARIVNDGVNFWITYNASPVVHGLSRVTTTAEVTTWVLDPNAPFSSVAVVNFDMFYERGRLVIHAANNDSNGASYTLTVFNVRTLVTESVLKNGALANGGTNARGRMIPGGDFSVIIAGVNSYTTFMALRYSAASIVGVSANSAEAGGQVSVYAQSGNYGINALRGTPSKAFDHSGASLPGNKGNLLNYGVILRGY